MHVYLRLLLSVERTPSLLRVVYTYQETSMFYWETSLGLHVCNTNVRLFHPSISFSEIAQHESGELALHPERVNKSQQASNLRH